jgi:hypothetical protein
VEWWISKDGSLRQPTDLKVVALTKPLVGSHPYFVELWVRTEVAIGGPDLAAVIQGDDQHPEIFLQKGILDLAIFHVNI